MSNTPTPLSPNNNAYISDCNTRLNCTNTAETAAAATHRHAAKQDAGSNLCTADSEDEDT